jgi:predicted dithiol-disulfide oxidoreductase (DUF899 family)
MTEGHATISERATRTRGPEESVTDKFEQPKANPAIADRDTFNAALSEQVEREKEVTHHNDRVSAARRRLPMVEVSDYRFEGPDGPIALTEMFDGRYLLMVQNFMFDPGWDEGCRSCTWSVDNLPANMGRLHDEGISFAMISQAPIERLESWRSQRGWTICGSPRQGRAITTTGDGPAPMPRAGRGRCRGTPTTF